LAISNPAVNDLTTDAHFGLSASIPAAVHVFHPLFCITKDKISQLRRLQPLKTE
jgi:hypothetical protein